MRKLVIDLLVAEAISKGLCVCELAERGWWARAALTPHREAFLPRHGCPLRGAALVVPWAMQSAEHREWVVRRCHTTDELLL